MFKSGTTLEPFSRDKLLLDVYESVKHREHALTDATALTDTIISQISVHVQDASIQRGVIIEVTAAVLERFDNAAAVHFRAFHKSD
jgi:transcriptional regulator NrdR family protein